MNSSSGDRVVRILNVSEFGDGTFDVMDNRLPAGGPGERSFDAKQLDAETALRAVAERLGQPDPVTGARSPEKARTVMYGSLILVLTVIAVAAALSSYEGKIYGIGVGTGFGLGIVTVALAIRRGRRRRRVCGALAPVEADLGMTTCALDPDHDGKHRDRHGDGWER